MKKIKAEQETLRKENEGLRVKVGGFRPGQPRAEPELASGVPPVQPAARQLKPLG